MQGYDPYPDQIWGAQGTGVPAVPGTGSTGDYAPQSPEAYDPVISTTERALREAAGSGNKYRYAALAQQLLDAREARANAQEIAQLQARTSRYGVDVASQDRMRQLVENARQFDARHGLDIAEAYTKFSSTPDMMWARSDFLSALNRVGSNGGTPAPISMSAEQPRAKTWQDFAAISGYGNGGGGGQGGGGGGGTDPRLSAANAVMKALPPSDDVGGGDNDGPALAAIRALYYGAKPGSLERLGEPRRKIAQAGLARGGLDPNLAEWEYQRSGIGQGRSGSYS